MVNCSVLECFGCCGGSKKQCSTVRTPDIHYDHHGQRHFIPTTPRNADRIVQHLNYGIVNLSSYSSDSSFYMEGPRSRGPQRPPILPSPVQDLTVYSETSLSIPSVATPTSQTGNENRATQKHSLAPRVEQLNLSVRSLSESSGVTTASETESDNNSQEPSPVQDVRVQLSLSERSSSSSGVTSASDTESDDYSLQELSLALRIQDNKKRIRSFSQSSVLYSQETGSCDVSSAVSSYISIPSIISYPSVTSYPSQPNNEFSNLEQMPSFYASEGTLPFSSSIASNLSALVCSTPKK
ncbi:osteocalcin 2-like [Procambarus clarkii]|uniref:osteocalcin 2-like n=1 Tax=Procambarus clarkii TaxID=6728 RepID=UPI003744AD5A